MFLKVLHHIHPKEMKPRIYYKVGPYINGFRQTQQRSKFINWNQNLKKLTTNSK